MWTPRRILLLIATTLLTVGAYVAYSAALGGIDGLPELPADYAFNPDAPPAPPPPEKGQLTKQMLKRAFGATSPEVVNSAIAYKLQVYQADKGVLVASGQPTFAPADQQSHFVEVAPFSIGFFGKPPGADALPGEIEEISTAHADRAILEFDKPVANVQDMRDNRKLIGFQLMSAPEIPSADTRRGKVWVTNNQKSADPGQFLVFNTVGPVYYKAPEEGAVVNRDVPQLYTSADVEVVDKRNLPRALRSTSTATTAAPAEELRDKATVEAILTGEVAPPPTVIAEGMKIFLTSSNDPAAKPGKRNSTGYSSVRLIELSRNVRFSLWTDGGGGFPGSNPTPAEGAAPAAPAPTDPPAALAAVAGVVADAAAVARKLSDKKLLIVETPGSFRFDFTTNSARFDSDGLNPTAGGRPVAVHRASATSDPDDIFCEVLQVQFEPPSEGKKPAATAGAGSGLKVKAMTATGQHVYVSVVSEQLLAQGTELRYVVDAANRRTVTTLSGPEVTANREKNNLRAGQPGLPGEIVIVSTDPPPGDAKAVKTTALRVNGPGDIDIFDAATKAKSVKAVWGRSLTQERVRVGEQDQDLLTFDGNAEFIDLKADMRLSATRLMLWLGSKAGAKPTASGSGNFSQAVPQRLDAIGSVASTSPDLVIKDTDLMKLWFRDIPTPAAVTANAAKPKPATPPVAAAPANPGAPPAAASEPPKPKPPIVLTARTIESWLVRYPQPADAVATKSAVPPPPVVGGSAGLKYELERAYCEDRVVVHQDPTEPKKVQRGLDIAGVKLNLIATRVNDELGQVMTVTGTPGAFAEVHFETTSLFGPVIKIDQLSNTVAIDGVGSLLMPSDTDFSGAPTGGLNELEIRFVKSMFFNGAKGTAEFLGQVNAVQRPARDALKPPKPVAPVVPVAAKIAADETWSSSRLLCHRLDVTFDRPIYFNQFKRDDTDKPREPGDGPKMRRADCVPVPDDELPPNAGPLAKKVSYSEEVYTRRNALVKAQLIEGRQIEVRLREKTQELFATGPGEVRILQRDESEPFRGPGDNAGPPPPRKPGEEVPFKLTLVKYLDSMTAVDKNKLFQTANFRNGANVWQIPTNNINLAFAAHLAPAGTTAISCSTSMEVSTSRPRPDAPAEQEMVAVGNAEFSNDDYTGHGSRITFKAKDITLEGTTERMASIYPRKRSVNQQTGTRAVTIIYRKDGTIVGDRAGTGIYVP